MKQVEEPNGTVCGDYFVNMECLLTLKEAPLVPAFLLSEFLYEVFKSA